MKMKWRMRHFLLLLLLLSFAMVGQVTAQVANLRILSINSDEFPTMRVVFDVRNRNGVPIENMTSEQLTIEEDEQAAEVTEVTPYVNQERPISLALVIDVSPSAQGQPLENAKEAANNLLDQLNEEDRIALISVRTEVSVDINQLDPDHEVDFTTDRNAVRNVVDFLQLAPDNTALYDAMLKAVNLTVNENVANRAIILMTDGFDNVSRVSTPDDPIIEANRSGIPIFTIGLGEPRDNGYLERVAVRTGGTFKETNNPEELTPLFSNVLELLKKEYTLTYQSGLEAGASGEHRLSISTRLEGRLVEELETFTLPDGVVPPPATTAEEEEGGAESPAEAATEVPEEGEAEATAEAGEEQPPEPVEPEEPKSWLEDNLRLVMGIAVVLLLLIVALIAFLVMRGRNDEEQEDWSASPSTVQSVGPYPSKAGPVTQEQNWSAGGESNAPVDHTKVGYGYPSGPQAMDERGVYPQTEHVGPVPPVGQGGTIPADPISPIPPTQAIPSANFSGESDPSAPNKTVIFTRLGAKKKPTPYLLRQEDNQRFELVSNRIFIGRSSDNGIHLNNETVSGKHAVIVKREDEILIQDTGSTNGTFLNEEEVKGRQLLKQGDLIRFGKVEMIFHTGEETNEQ